MPNSEALLKTTRDVSAALTPAIESLQARNDYSKKQTQYGSIVQFKDVVAILNGLHRNLLSYQMSSSPSAADLKSAVDQANTIEVLLTGIMEGNLAMSKMQPLNTNRTIEPKEALAQNKVLKTLYDVIQIFIAQSQATHSSGAPTPPKPAPVEPKVTPPTEPAPSKDLQTYVTVANGMPYKVTLTTTVKNASDWPSSANRPDKTLNAPDGGARVLEGFAEITGRVDINAMVSSAVYQIHVAVEVDEGNTQSFSFTCDQSVLKTLPKEEDIKVREAKSDSGVGFFIYELALKRDDGTPELAVSIADKGA